VSDAREQHDAAHRRRLRGEVLSELGDCRAALGDYDAARECYAEAGRMDPSSPRPHVGLGFVGVQLGRPAEAWEAFSRAAALDGDCAEAYGGMAMVRQQQKDYTGAFDMYLRCLERDVDNLAALLGLFQTSCQMGTFGKIIHFLEVYLERHPGDTSVLFCLASLYVKEDDLPRARERLLDVLALEPDKPEAAELLRDVEAQLDPAALPQAEPAQA
jgi:tetratricopeptide (TPR) repeat protein